MTTTGNAFLSLQLGATCDPCDKYKVESNRDTKVAFNLVHTLTQGKVMPAFSRDGKYLVTGILQVISYHFSTYFSYECNEQRYERPIRFGWCIG